ncbi:MAG: response regulator [Chloroflexi bacterium]|nr:response regulator [Chloroflexota bacterium]
MNPSASESIFASIRDGIFLIGQEDNVCYANQQLAELLEITLQDVVQCPYSCLFSKFASLSENPRHTLDTLLESLKHLHQFPRTNIRIRDASQRYLQLELFSIANKRNGLCWGGMLRDISDEYHQGAHGLKSLLAIIDSFRSSLVYVLGYSTTLLSDDQQWRESEQREFVTAIKENTEQVVQWLENIRDILRLQLHEQELERRFVDLKHIITQVVQRVSREASALTFEVNIPDNIPLVEMDSIRMSRAMQKLLENILKLSSTSTIRLTARHTDSKVQVDVYYHGMSFAEIRDKRLKEAAFGNSASGYGRINDLELSLYIVHSILAAHGGHLWIEEMRESGIVVHIDLPHEQHGSKCDSDLRTHLTARRTDEGVPALSKYKVLVIENDARISRLLKGQLERAGYQVIMANEGQSAIDLAVMKVPDIILLDLNLPDTNGFDICLELREFTSAPVIVLAAHANEEDMVRSLSIGDDYLPKPLHVKELLARIQANLRRSHMSNLAEQARSDMTFKAGDLEIDFAQRCVMLGGNPINLTPIEYRLLHCLCVNAGRILTHDQLVSKIWGPMFKQETQYLWVNISRLRAKIEQDPSNPKYILTERGVGYYFPDANSFVSAQS